MVVACRLEEKNLLYAVFHKPGFDPESGLHYNFFRYYDTETGRYISVDPARDGVNLYAYCEANPLNFVDPYGLCPTLTVYVKKGQPAGQRDSQGGWGHAWIELKDINDNTIAYGFYPEGVIIEVWKPSELRKNEKTKEHHINYNYFPWIPWATFLYIHPKIYSRRVNFLK